MIGLIDQQAIAALTEDLVDSMFGSEAEKQEWEERWERIYAWRNKHWSAARILLDQDEESDRLAVIKDDDTLMRFKEQPRGTIMTWLVENGATISEPCERHDEDDDLDRFAAYGPADLEVLVRLRWEQEHWS